MADFVTQCFETYPQFGDDGGTLKTKIKAFTVGLEDHLIDDIAYAFRHWLKVNTKMPLPADIGAIASEQVKFKRDVTKPYTRPALPAPENRNKVPWAGKTWAEIERHHMGQLEQHLVELTALKGKERAAEYLRYLKCGM